jgi:hypothetical protein
MICEPPRDVEGDVSVPVATVDLRWRSALTCTDIPIISGQLPNVSGVWRTFEGLTARTF